MLKPPKTVDEHIRLLRERGMEVDDSLARQWLSNVSYYRLSAYWYPARCFDASGQRADYFKSGTKFHDAVALYEADRKLRTLVHDGMERIEIAMRTQLIERLCCHSSGSSLAYLESSRFRPTFNHLKWLSTIYIRLARQSNSAAVQHHREKYNGQYPFWVVAEVADFSDISRLYAGLKTTEQRKIAENLGIKICVNKLSKSQKEKVRKNHPLAGWLEQLTVVRNTAAHHGRLWNKSFAPAPTAALRTDQRFAFLPENQSERVFGTLVVMAHLLSTVSPGTTWPEKVVKLITDDFLVNALANNSSLGVPANWDRQKLVL
ncbi:Abi family protein [Corynebacterium freiburgense]|uniref:Abi family protein n=1 Tax=Corynebacterium freiburgense TaxID=556548 RepID=UPI0003FBDBD1|nr:Abi family protein [Corynebacterium freiburgense]WJZ01633.1 Abi-like protein [Corynebacterium freiburgense]